jgi:hypothetical protein
LACCVLHNYCELHKECVIIPANFKLQYDPYVKFHVGRMQLPREGEAAKIVGKEMRNVLFSSWMESNPK